MSGKSVIYQHCKIYFRGFNYHLNSMVFETSGCLQLGLLLITSEVTALRAKLAEVSEQQSRSEARVRDQVRREFSSAMRKLFALSFEQKARIDEYRNHLHAVTLKRISEVRDEAAIEMERIKEKSGAKSSAGRLARLFLLQPI